MDDKNGKRSGIEEAVMNSMLFNTTDMIYVKDTELIYRAASQSFARLVKRSHPSELVGKKDADLFEDEGLVHRYTEDDQRLLESGEPLKAYVEPFPREDGSRGYCQTSKYPLFDSGGKLIGLYGVSHDITWEYQARLNYEQELQALFELPPDALAATLFDLTNRRVVDTRLGTAKECIVFEFGSVDEFIRDSVIHITEDEEVREFYRSFSLESLQQMYKAGKRRMSLEYQRMIPDEGIRWVRNDLYFLSDPVSRNFCVMAILLDIDNEKQAADALARAAQRDALTDVYNREATMARISRFLSEEGAEGTHLLFMIDVDNFKLINDTFGHQAGDQTLIYIAQVIRKVFRETDIVGRVGGDEFFVMMKDASNPVVARRKAKELIEALQYEYSEGSSNVMLSGSVGISRYAADGKTLEMLYAEADSALYKAKQAGKNCYVYADGAAVSWEDRDTLNAVNLRTLLENMDAAMFQTELDREGGVRVTYSSHSLFVNERKGTDYSGAKGEDIWNVILPEDREVLEEAVRKAVKTGTALNCSSRVHNAEGQIEWRHISGSQLPDQGDGIQRMIHVATDITSQKKTEAELREKNSIIDFAMRNTDVNMWYFNYDTSTCQLTKSCQKAHEMPGVEELSNFPECLFEMGYVREDCMELVRTQYEQLRITGESREFDVWFRKADGSGWWCERDSISPLIDADGRVTRGIGIGKNVTSEKVLAEKYETFGAYRRLAEKNTRVSFRMNLSTGWFGDCITGVDEVRSLYEDIVTMDHFLYAFRCRMTSAEDIEQFDQTFTREQLLRSFAGGDTLRSMECHFRDERNRIIWLRVMVEMMQNPITGDVEGLLYSFDIDHEKNMQCLVDKLLDEDYEFLGLIDVLTGELMVFGDHAEIPGMARNGFPYETEMRRVFKGLILDEYYEEGVRNMSCAHVVEELTARKSYTCSFPARDFAHTPAGRKQWKFSYLDDSKSKILMARSDITGIYTAEYDSLTGLYNRETLYQRIRTMLEENPSVEFLLVRFDIDRFKAFNDVYGSQAGDRLLASAGRSVRMKVRPELSVYGRLEADHFVFVMPVKEFDIDIWSAEHAEELRAASDGYRLTSSVGVYKISDPNVEVSLMCDRALLALRTVKDSYTQKVAWYNEKLREKLMQEQALADDMEQALLEEQFVLYFQPLVNYDDGSLIGAEALVRWRHPTRGLIPPGEFIPMFEKNGFILKLDAFVWERSCRYLREWIDAGKNAMPVSVNVSRCDLYDPQLCERFEQLLCKYQIPHSLIKLEITESAYMEDPDQLIGIVDRLRSAGFIVEMDDFGTGYSSLNMLKDVPVDILKLDTRFIAESEGDNRATTILSSIIQMANQLGLSVIAEGVETKAQADSLKGLDCSKMQGYYFSHPVCAADFEAIMDKGGMMNPEAAVRLD